jgi:glutathionylspermidine synthase
LIRITCTPRRDWVEKVESVGMLYHTIEGEIYWDESAYYKFSSAEIDTIEDVTNELYAMCLKAVEHIIRNKLFPKIGIQNKDIPLVTESWQRKDPSMYGRFDFIYDGNGQPKLLEFNADTPTALLEASVVQWFWMKDIFPDKDQFNSIHEKLEEFWKGCGFDDTVYFTCIRDTEEDLGNVEYIRDVAGQAGCNTRHIFIDEIGWSASAKKFVDLDNNIISAIFKLYPWEWLMDEEFGKQLFRVPWTIIEPAWKSMLSNKAILPLLWELYPDHPNLLPAYFDNRFTDNYVQKPFFSREGENIRIVKNGTVYEKDGTYGREGYIFQEYRPVPEFDGNYTTIGSWIINGQAAGIGIREDKTEITMNSSRFIPHIFEE